MVMMPRWRSTLAGVSGVARAGEAETYYAGVLWGAVVCTRSDCGQYSIASGTPGSRLGVKEWQCGECPAGRWSRWCAEGQEKNGQRVARTDVGVAPALRLLHHSVAFVLQLSSPTGMFDCPPAV